jgi:4-hydroxybenzoate polyprenyltransferase
LFSVEKMSISRQSPFIQRFFAWINERFPLGNAILFLVIYVAGILWGQLLTHDGRLHLSLGDLPGFFAFWAFFLMLRVFDEHKDYELDLRNHPQRVLQSGLITLRHLKIAGAIAIALQHGVSLFVDRGFGAATRMWLVVMGWSTLMAREFFVGEWLGKRLVLYALSHMVVLPMAMVWIAQMGAGGADLPIAVLLLPALSFFSGFAFEITRKTRAPEQERDTVDSYSRVFGTRGAPLVVLVLVLAQTMGVALLLRHVFDGAPHFAWYATLLPILGVPAASVLVFRAAPSEDAAKRNEGTVALSTMLSYAVLVAAIIVRRGVGS